MESYFSRKIRIVSAILIVALLAGFLPWRELSADSATHGEYTSSPFTISYEQNSTWGNSTQGQFEVTNTSAYDITSWSLEIDYLYDVSLTNIWNVSGTVTDGNVIVSSNSTIESGQTYTFGLIVEGQDSSPISPVSVTALDYVSSQPNVTPTPTPTEEPTPTSEPTEEPTNTPTVTVTPTPSEEQTEVFPYAIFSASTTDDFVFQGWKSNIVGDIYSGKDFLYQGSELTMTGFARTVGIVNPSGWKTSMTGAQEHIQPLPIPDWSLSILAKEDDMPSISETDLTAQDSVIANGYYYTNGNITINGAEFTGDAVIVAHGDITYNVNSLNAGEEATGRILLYSEEGNITINGTQIEVNGILYAPNGRVSINAYNTTLNGRIVADKFSYNGSILNVTADPSDLQIVLLSGFGIAKGVKDIIDGYWLYGSIEILLGIYGLYSGIGLVRGGIGNLKISNSKTQNPSTASNNANESNTYANNTNTQNGKLAADRVANGDVPCIGKMKDLNADNSLLNNEFAIADYLPNRGTPRANWEQNDTVLRSVMSENAPIKDVSQFPMENAGFLGAERSVLENHGWIYSSGWWYPPFYIV